jgi:hypothetical protein
MTIIIRAIFLNCARSSRIVVLSLSSSFAITSRCNVHTTACAEPRRICEISNQGQRVGTGFLAVVARVLCVIGSLLITNTKVRTATVAGATLIALSGCASSPTKLPQIEASRGQYGIPFRGEVVAIDLLSAVPLSDTRYGETLGELAVRVLNRKRTEDSMWTDLVRLWGTALTGDLEQYMTSLNCVYTLRTADVEVADSVSNKTLQSDSGLDTFVDSESETFIYNDNRSTTNLRRPGRTRYNGDLHARSNGSGSSSAAAKQGRRRGDDAEVANEARAGELHSRHTKNAKGRFISVMHNCVARIGVGDVVGVLHLGERMALFPTVTSQGIADLGSGVLATAQEPSAPEKPIEKLQRQKLPGSAKKPPPKTGQP